MNKLTIFLLSGLLLIGAAACNPGADTTTKPGSQPDNAAQKDANSQIRRQQADSDIRAREQRNNIAGNPEIRADGDLESEVRSKLEVNLANSKLQVQAKNGSVTVSGTVSSQDHLNKIQPLTQEIKGVKNVTVQAQVVPAKN